MAGRVKYFRLRTIERIGEVQVISYLKPIFTVLGYRGNGFVVNFLLSSIAPAVVEQEIVKYGLLRLSKPKWPNQ